jgi:Tol biopolymer transport system component
VLRVVALVAVLSTIGCAGSADRPDEFTGAIAYTAPRIYGAIENSVFTVDAADATVTRIGRRSSTGAPTWSPDGASLAYSTPDYKIMIADASGGSEKRLARHFCTGPVFSPEGSLLACDITEPNAITVLDASDGSVVAQTGDCCWQPAWSPNGRQVAYVSYGTFDRKGLHGPSGLFVMNADGTHRRRLAKNVSYNDKPAWSSRDLIAFVGEGVISTVRASGGGLRILVPRDGDGLAWAPDGAKLAYTGGDGDFEIFIVNADGTGLENLTDNEKIQDESPSWSPDGKAIAFVREPQKELAQVFVMRADGSGQTQLTHNDRAGKYHQAGKCCPMWSPAG